MTPKEKADELIDKMYYIGRYYDQETYIPKMAWERARQCALIAVDEIIKSNPYECDAIEILHSNISYWQEVKQVIEKL
jgi:putative lipoic acid-binding regulatory protein